MVDSKSSQERFDAVKASRRVVMGLKEELELLKVLESSKVNMVKLASLILSYSEDGNKRLG